MRAPSSQAPEDVERMISVVSDMARKRWIQTGRDECTMVIRGSFEALAERMGSTSAEARDALRHGASIRLKWGSVTINGLWSFHHLPATRSSPAALHLTLSPALRPGSELFMGHARKAPRKGEVVKPLPFTIYRLSDGSHVLHESRGGIRAATPLVTEEQP